MEENLAANNRDFATPEGAANLGEGAPLPSLEASMGASDPEPAPLDSNSPAKASSMPEAKEDGREWTRKVAQRIKEERQKAQAELIEDLFGDEEGCAKYRQQRAQQEAAEADLAEAAIFAELALAADPELGGHYLALEDEVRDFAEAHGADLESAFLLVLKQHLPRLLREERQKGEQDLLNRLSAHGATPGSLADAAAPAMGLGSLNDAEFAAMVARVKRGELNSLS